MPKRIVSREKWRDAIKYLMGANPCLSLTLKDKRELYKLLRGPFLPKGFSEQQAQKILHLEGWSIGDE